METHDSYQGTYPGKVSRTNSGCPFPRGYAKHTLYAVNCKVRFVWPSSAEPWEIEQDWIRTSLGDSWARREQYRQSNIMKSSLLQISCEWQQPHESFYGNTQYPSLGVPRFRALAIPSWR